MSVATRVKRASPLSPRSKPSQDRSRERTQKILDATAKLLDEVGFDGLTTILVAKELNISVGSLYHYFPNKHAILFALGKSWLAEMTLALEDTAALELEQLTLEQFVSHAIDRMFKVYQTRYDILPLAQALWAIPELRALDEEHDDLFISKMTQMFKRIGFKQGGDELVRLGRFYLETMHAMMLVIVNQPGQRGTDTYNDLKRVLVGFLAQYHAKHS